MEATQHTFDSMDYLMQFQELSAEAIERSIERLIEQQGERE